MNNLKALRRARNWTQNEAAAKLSTTISQYTKLERGSRRLSDKWIDRAAAAYDVDPGEIVRGETKRPPIVGRVIADGSIEWIMPRALLGEYALEVKTAALGPLLDGSMIVFTFDDRPRQTFATNRLCVVSAVGLPPCVGKLTKSGTDMHHVQCIHGAYFDLTILWASVVSRIDFL